MRSEWAFLKENHQIYHFPAKNMAFQPGSKKLQFSIKMGVDILDGRNSIAYKDV